MSFRLKTIFGVALIEASLLIILVWSSINMMRESNEALLLQRAESSAQLFVSMIKDPVLSFDLATLETSVQELLTTDGLAYVQVWGYDTLLTSGGTLPTAELRAQLQQDSGFVDEQQLFIKTAPIKVGDESYGRIEIGFNAADIQARLSSALYNTSALALAEILLSALFSFLLGSWLVRQLADLRDASKAISEGQYGVQIPVRGKDEIAQTASLFNDMSAGLLAATTELKELNLSLESLVDERTADLRYSNRSLGNIIQSMSDALIVVDEEGTILRTNPAFHRYTDITEENLGKYNMFNLLLNVGHISAGDIISHTAKQQHEMLLRTQANKKIPVLVNSAMIETDNGTHWVINIQDLRDVKRAEETERFQAFRDGAEEVRIDVAHNLGNNLTSIIGQTHTMQQQKQSMLRLEQGLKNYLKLIEKELDSLPEGLAPSLSSLPNVLNKTTQLLDKMTDVGMEKPAQAIEVVIEDIAHLFQVPSGNSMTKRGLTDFNLKAVCEDVEMALFAQLQMRHCKVVYDLEDDFSLSLVPRNQFAQAWQSLLENAMQSMPSGGEITISATRENTFVYITMLDQGTGMTEDVLAQAKQRNFSTKTGTHSGNGLHQVANFVYHLDSDLILANAPEQGLKVTLKLPQLMEHF